jgi:hypothetical protein
MVLRRECGGTSSTLPSEVPGSATGMARSRLKSTLGDHIHPSNGSIRDHSRMSIAPHTRSSSRTRAKWVVCGAVRRSSLRTVAHSQARQWLSSTDSSGTVACPRGPFGSGRTCFAASCSARMGPGLHKRLAWTKSGEASGSIDADLPAAGGVTAIRRRSARTAASRSAIGLMARTRIASRR